MPIVIREHARLKDFDKLLPKVFHKCRRPKLSANDCVTIVTFPESVVQSRLVLHTLEQTPQSTERIVMYAENFTQEAFKVMREKGVFYDSLREFEWTDESYVHCKVRIGSRVKQRSVTKKDRSRNPH